MKKKAFNDIKEIYDSVSIIKRKTFIDNFTIANLFKHFILYKKKHKNWVCVYFFLDKLQADAYQVIILTYSYIYTG